MDAVTIPFSSFLLLLGFALYGLVVSGVAFAIGLINIAQRRAMKGRDQMMISQLGRIEAQLRARDQEVTISHSSLNDWISSFDGGTNQPTVRDLDK